MLKKTLEKKQADLLLKIVPFLRNVMCFAFNGGTVINFFCSDTFKRYSVDLDGVFIPPKEMKNVSKKTITSLTNKELSKLKNELESPTNKRILGIVRIDHLRNKRLLRIHACAPTSKNDIIKVKLEVHGAYTYTTEDVVIRRLGSAAREEFNTDCEIRSVNDAKLYSGKFIAFLARNSVKDGYDMDHLFKEGINSESLKKVCYTIF